jgi:hypothetical protein
MHASTKELTAAPGEAVGSWSRHSVPLSMINRVCCVDPLHRHELARFNSERRQGARRTQSIVGSSRSSACCVVAPVVRPDDFDEYARRQHPAFRETLSRPLYEGKHGWQESVTTIVGVPERAPLSEIVIARLRADVSALRVACRELTRICRRVLVGDGYGCTCCGPECFGYHL